MNSLLTQVINSKQNIHLLKTLTDDYKDFTSILPKKHCLN